MTVDPFLRADKFAKEPWYGELQIFLRIGICRPLPEYRAAVKAALTDLGYETREITDGYDVFLSGS